MAFESPLFPPNTNIVMACHITGVRDVNRNTTLANDSYDLVKDWVESITAANLQGVIFHNNFSEATCKSYENENISFVKIAYDSQFNPNVFRYFVYRDFLQQHIQQVKGIFITDITDVVLVVQLLVNSTWYLMGDRTRIDDQVQFPFNRAPKALNLMLVLVL